MADLLDRRIGEGMLARGLRQQNVRSVSSGGSTERRRQAIYSRPLLVTGRE
jgi:hypothetical protein